MGVVSGATASVAGYLAIGAVAVAVDTYLRVGEVFLVAHDGDDGQGVVAAGLDIAAGDGYAGQKTILEEPKGEIGGVVEGEPSVLALLRGFYGCAVVGIELPAHVVEIVVVVLLVNIQVEHDGLHPACSALT